MVYFVGAGPGAVDLITVRGRTLIENAEIIIYAGSLVSKEHLKYAKESCAVFDSASMTLEEIIAVIKENADKLIVRLHTGDPSIYGAICEQMNELDTLGVEYEIIPGVSSCTAAAAAVKKELTPPGVSQTVILTRIAGRTPVPESENLAALAQHKAGMAIFLSAQKIKDVAAELLKGYKDENTPAAVVYKATWAEEKIILGTLGTIAEKTELAGINKTAQILVGNFLNGTDNRSDLYNPSFTHEFRAAKNPPSPADESRQENKKKK